MTEATNVGNNANYYLSEYLIGSPYYRTVAGEFELSDSPYGTFDQGGNVREWNETKLTSLYRGMRGGSFLDVSDHLRASNRGILVAAPTEENDRLGFRVAGAIPEPASLTLCLAGILMLVLRRRNK
jgi:formylglycine-generating enzyme required for sulfatase activity